MKTKMLHLPATFKAVEEEDGSMSIEGYASTNDLDRAGDIILSDAWTKEGGLENFRKNPILLFNHDYDKPIGKADTVEVDDKGLKIKAYISKAAGDVGQLIKDGILKTFSVGFRIKDAFYDSNNDIYYIKSADLYEVSVVSLPCNQDAVFSVAKAFDSEDDYKQFVKQLNTPAEQPAEDSVNAQDSAGQEAIEEPIKKENKMDPEQIKEMLEQVARDTAKAIIVEQSANAAKEKEKADNEAKETERLNVQITTAAEKLMADVETRFKEKNESLESIVDELKNELKEKSGEIEKMRSSKHTFSDRGNGSDWKKEFSKEAEDTFILGLATGKGWDTKRAKGLIEKVNAHSGVEVSSADFEQIVSTNIERDIEQELILAPLFRELPMTSATMIFPIMPDSGYAQFADGATYATRNGVQTAPDGNLSERDGADNAGIALKERTVSTKKLMSTSFLGNETEEDAILPILPLIREAMVRSHARAVENAILLGNHAQGAFGIAGASFDGLIKMAVDDTQTTQADGAYAVSDVVTAADLFALRKGMGKYGINPADVIYIVSTDALYNLVEDAEFQDANLVTAEYASKIKGTVGQVYGSRVIVCPEFAEKGANSFNAVAVNTRNFAIPRLRGMRIESDYEVREQRRVLVASQRLGFIDVIDGAAAKWALQNKAEI